MDFFSYETVQTYWHLLVLGVVILALMAFFVFRFLVPSWKLGRALQKANINIQQLKPTHCLTALL